MLIRLAEIDPSQRALVGDKAANLAELARIPGIHVPEGFCITTLDRDEVQRALDDGPYAVRSSATAEDLPTASFAGQYDSYLNVAGADVLAHVERCAASRENPRAVAYRARHGIDDVRMAVIVQRMVRASAAGVLFTADPLTGKRTVSAIDAVHGLGDALVAGHANPDNYRVRAGTIVERRGDVLSDEQVVRLEQIGRTIEAHFGCPQDIEWCLADDVFWIVQSRPITTLFPVPPATDTTSRVYISVGHQQMMTDAMKPLGLSVFQLSAAGMVTAGGRLFVDVTHILASPGRESFLTMFGAQHPLIEDALRTWLARGEQLVAASVAPNRAHQPMSLAEILGADADSVPLLIAAFEQSLAALTTAIETKHGPDLFAFLREDIAVMKQLRADPRSMTAILAGIHAQAWLDEHIARWLGEHHAADRLAVPTNVTSEMGLALLDVADAVRSLAPDDMLAHPAVATFLARYGMRGPGEIDITRDRWAERPSALLPILLGNQTLAPGEGRRQLDRRRDEAWAYECALLARLTPDQAAETAPVIDVVRAFIGYREYPKFHIVSRYFVYKQALLREADALVRDGVIRDREDIYYLTFDELEAAVRTRQVDASLVARRRADYHAFAKLTPPRVITSDGEIITGSYKHANLPAGALAGLGVSSGVVEGRARVVRALEDAALEEGDILVTPFTDPSWTPTFVAIAGLVTEAGGLMTHGAVIAREYGLPAVVGVERATERIRDGQRIRIDGTAGYIELL